MLLLRVASAVVGVPAILGLIFLGGVGYSLALAAVLCLAVWEFYRATDPQPPGGEGLPLAVRPAAFLGIGGVALLIAAVHNGVDWWNGALALLVALAFLAALVLNRDTAAAYRDWLWLVAGLVYVGFLGSHFVLVRQLDHGRDWALLAVFATFSTDTAAYFGGRLFGRTKLVPRLSPGKTVEGSLAGLLAGFIAVLALNRLPGLQEDTVAIAFLGLLLPLAAEIGDLAESLVKRSGGVKDASALVPGHGGLLDRLDSLLFTAPLVYYYVLWVIL